MTGTKTPNLVCYDIRGHGTAWMPVDKRFNDTDVTNYAWSLETFVNDCKRVYDNTVGGGKVIVCGFGFGGFIAQKFALTHPELVQKLVLLQTSIRPITGLYDEINYLGGPQGWIAKNPHMTYLTSEERFVQQTLCDWFYLPPESGCPPDKLIDPQDGDNDWTSPQYNLIAAMWRQGSSTTTLQTDKLLASTDLVDDWVNAKGISFNVHILAATDDPLASPEMMANTYTTIYNNNRHLVVAFDVVNGRHGFTIMRPDYISGIVCRTCKRLSAQTTWLQRSPDQGY
jgi:pimeloyl-ACP methyl ester carboxylesterase